MDEKTLEKLTDFIQKYLPYRDRDFVRKGILDNSNYHTIDYAIDNKGEIVGICRWNIINGGKDAHILDLVVREDFRKRGVGRDFLIKGLRFYKNVTHLVFEREFRGDKKQRRIPVEIILKSKKF